MAIRKITLTSGATTYEAVLDGPRDGSTGKRKQLRRRFKTRREAAAWEAESKTTISAGTFVGRDRTTIADYLRGWTAGRTDVKPATRQNYQDALQVPLAAFGGRPLQDLSKSDVDRMVAGMLDGSLRRVGRAGEPLSPGRSG